MADVAPPPLQVHEVSKTFPGVRALDRVSLTLAQGEVLAVIGENGAGKSTLMKVLAGVQEPDSGHVRVDGEVVCLNSVRVAQRLGIALIHQELNLADNLDVAANLFLGRERHRRGVLNRRSMYAQAPKWLGKVGLNISPRTIVGLLPIGRQQAVEIAKALSADARILIMDEPTSSLSQAEADTLFKVIDQLRSAGMSIIYVSHRLGEVKRLADRVVVLRDGRNVGELQRGDISHDGMVQLMVGRDVAQFYARTQHQPGDSALRARGVVSRTHPTHKLSFDVRASEIVALGGLVGAGRSELLRTLFGIDPPLEGTVEVADRPIRLDHPRHAIAAGMALVPEDRKQQGLIIDMAVRSNVSLAGLHANRRRGGVLNREVERKHSSDMISQLGIRTPSDRQTARFLSGGNQQKVVLGKWLAMRPRVLLLDEPTRGIDVGAKEEIYRLMERLAAEGVAILFASSEMEELLGMADRVLVMHQGRLAGELPRSKLSEEAIMHLATGGSPATASPDSAILATP